MHIQSINRHRERSVAIQFIKSSYRDLIAVSKSVLSFLRRQESIADTVRKMYSCLRRDDSEDVSTKVLDPVVKPRDDVYYWINIRSQSKCIGV